MIINENNATCCLGDVAKLFSSFLAEQGCKGRTPSRFASPNPTPSVGIHRSTFGDDLRGHSKKGGGGGGIGISRMTYFLKFNSFYLKEKMYCNDPNEWIPNRHNPFSSYLNGLKMPAPPPPHFSGLFPLKRKKIDCRRPRNTLLI